MTLPLEKDVLADLLGRFEQATGPDTAIDRRLCWALGQYPWAGTSEAHLDLCMPKSKIAKETPALTASIDAAVALVEKALPDTEWMVSQAKLFHMHCHAVLNSGHGEVVSATGVTPPLAILAALLKALSLPTTAMQEGGEHGR